MSTYDTSTLNLKPNLTEADNFYDELLQAHQSLTDQQSEEFNARLILILCNHIGNRNILTKALAAAKLES